MFVVLIHYMLVMVFQTWNHGGKKEKGKQFYC